jgi:predicted RNA-binding protein with TRAM domain
MKAGLDKFCPRRVFIHPSKNPNIMYEYGFKGSKPVEEGKEYTVTITDVGSQGDGVAKVNGFIIFVPDTKVGQTVKVKVMRVMKKSAFARVVP